MSLAAAPTSALASAPNVPLIGFGEVRHTRLRPRRNAFTYPTCFLLLPMRSLPHTAGALAVNRAGALSFHDQDHGDGRGPAQGGALAWMEELLRAEGIRDALGEIWLQCYPRMLGHSFKPVSFWYCHRADGALRAIVAEVNNTFGERHCYLLDAPQFGVAQQADKVFHVSPFCDVAGVYRFRFMRAQHPGEAERIVARVDHDDAQGPLLQTSLSGELQAISPASLRRALWGHPALTLVVQARIHWQAARLWWRRTGFRRKPLPPTQFVTR